MSEHELMLSPAEIAKRVGVSIDAVRRAIRAGDLPAAKVFGRVRVHQRDLDRYIDEHAIAPASTVRDLIDVGRRIPAPRRGSLRAHLQAEGRHMPSVRKRAETGKWEVR